MDFVRSIVMLFICCAPIRVCAQQIADDSLLRRLREAQTMVEKAKIHYHIGDDLVNQDTAKAVSFVRQGLTYAKGSPFHEGLGYFYLGRIYMEFSRSKAAISFDSAIYYLAPIATAESAIYQSRIWANKAVLAQMNGDNTTYIRLFLEKAIPLAGKGGDSLRMADGYTNVSLPFMNFGQYEKAMLYLNKSAALFRRLAPNDLRQIDIYCHLAKIYLLQDKVDGAERNLQLASELLKDDPTSLYAPNFHAIESMYFIRRKLWTDALQTIEKGLRVAEKLGARQEIRLLRYQKAKLFEGQRNWPAAKQVLLTMYQQGFVELNTDKKQLFEDLATIDSNLGNYRGAYEWMLKHKALSEEVYAQQTKLQIAGLEAKYNYDQKEKELLVAQDKAERQRTIIWLVVSIAVIALIVVYFWYQSWRRRTIQQLRQQQQIELGKALLDGEERERSRLARDLHDGLGGMLAGIKLNLAQMIEQQTSLGEADLKQTVDRLGYSVKELRRIARNLMPESLVRSGLEAALKDLCTEATLPTVMISFKAFDIQPYFSAQVQLMIYRIVQELIYNALKHAVASRIIVQCSQSGEMFFITVEDNGKGFPTAARSDTGQGLKNIHNRVDLLNGKIEVESSVEGTNIYIELYVE